VGERRHTREATCIISVQEAIARPVVVQGILLRRDGPARFGASPCA